jgi:hypothetical protein
LDSDQVPSPLFVFCISYFSGRIFRFCPNRPQIAILLPMASSVAEITDIPSHLAY